MILIHFKIEIKKIIKFNSAFLTWAELMMNLMVTTLILTNNNMITFKIFKGELNNN